MPSSALKNHKLKCPVGMSKYICLALKCKLAKID